MPHVIVKLWPGRDEEIKKNLAKRIADTVAEEPCPLPYRKFRVMSGARRCIKQRLKTIRTSIRNRITSMIDRSIGDE